MKISFNRLLFRIGLALLILCAALTLFPLPQSTTAVVTLEFLGSFHPLFLHLPIGLWFGLLLLLFADSFTKEHSLNGYLYAGACVTYLTGVVAFITGANLYLAGSYSRNTLVPHMYAALIFLAGVFIFCVLAKRKAHNSFLWLTAVGSMAVLGFAGHVGGVITHGDPMDKAPWVVLKQQAEEDAFKKEARLASAADPLIFDHVVMPILENKCINCHGTSRAKGKLRMDSFDALVQGGSQGPSLIPGDVSRSLMLERVHLPLKHKEHMPPKDKEQLTEEEVVFLEWWVANAADPGLRVARTTFPDEIKPLIAAFTGDSPEAIQRRQERELKAKILETHAKVSAAFPGILTQAVQGEATFELNSASIYAIDEAALRDAIKPLVPYITRIDWHNRAMDADWLALLSECRKLKVLNLNQAAVSEPELISILNNNPDLDSLNFYGANVSDAIIPALKPRIATGELSSVNLSETKLSPEGLSELKAAVPKVTLRY